MDFGLGTLFSSITKLKGELGRKGGSRKWGSSLHPVPTGVAVFSPVLGSRVEQVWQVSDSAAAHTGALGQVWPLNSLPLRSANNSLQGQDVCD